MPLSMNTNRAKARWTVIAFAVITAVSLVASPASATVSTLQVLTGPNGGSSFPAAEYPWSEPGLQGTPLSTVFGGSGCNEDADGDGVVDRDRVPRRSFYPGLAQVAVVFVDGDCSDVDKIESGMLAGYEAVLVAADHKTARFGLAPHAYRCSPPPPRFEVNVGAFCTGHEALHVIFNSDAGFSRTDTADLPELGTVGETIQLNGS